LFNYFQVLPKKPRLQDTESAQEQEQFQKEKEGEEKESQHKKQERIKRERKEEPPSKRPKPLEEAKENPSSPLNSHKKRQQLSTDEQKKRVGFWNETTEVIANEFWLPTRDSLQELETLDGTYLQALARNCWFHAPAKQGPVPESYLNLARLMERRVEEVENFHKKNGIDPARKNQRIKKRNNSNKTCYKKEGKTKKPPAGKARKIRLYPNKEEREKLSQWFGAARWTYNECCTAVYKHGMPFKLKVLRNFAVNQDSLKARNLDWLFNTPRDIRDEALRDFLKAYDACKAKGNNFKLEPRKKKESESIVIPHRGWRPRKNGKVVKNSTNTYQFLKKIKSSEPLPRDLKYDSRLKKTKDGRYYLCIPRPLQPRTENQGQQLKEVVAIDPGVSTFAATYDTTGLVTEWGKQDIEHIIRICIQIDRIKSQIAKKDYHNRRERLVLEKRMGKKSTRIQNLVTDIHHKFAKWLCLNYRYVLLPIFSTQDMVCKAQRRINSETARKLLTWSHYKFRMRLLDKAREYPWCKVIICDEHYTSKTCGKCGFIHKDLGTRKDDPKLRKQRIFRCPGCKNEFDRDLNASRNILLRFLTKALIVREKQNPQKEGGVRGKTRRRDLALNAGAKLQKKPRS
jgi:transposase